MGKYQKRGIEEKYRPLKKFFDVRRKRENFCFEKWQILQISGFFKNILYSRCLGQQKIDGAQLCAFIFSLVEFFKHPPLHTEPNFKCFYISFKKPLPILILKNLHVKSFFVVTSTSAKAINFVFNKSSNFGFNSVINQGNVLKNHLISLKFNFRSF